MMSSDANTRLAHVPPLSIRHLLIWTAMAAAVLGAFRGELGLKDNDPLSVGMLSMFAVSVAWLYAGGLLIVYHARKKTLWPLEPGEWLTLWAINVVTVLGLWGVIDRAGFGPNAWKWFLALIPAEFAIAALIPAITQRKRRVWSVMFFAIAVACASAYLLVLVRILNDYNLYQFYFRTIITIVVSYVGGFSLIVFGLLVAGIVTDWRRREPRHWLHWSAVALTVLGLIGLNFLALNLNVSP